MRFNFHAWTNFSEELSCQVSNVVVSHSRESSVVAVKNVSGGKWTLHE